MPFDAGTITKKHTKISVTLLRAAEYIEDESRWCVGRINRRNWFGRLSYCAIGAVQAAVENYHLAPDAVSVASYLDKAAKAHGFTCISALNDHPDTTHALVMQVYREAVELAMVE